MASFYRRSSTDGVLLLTMKPLSFYYKFLCKPGGGGGAGAENLHNCHSL